MDTTTERNFSVGELAKILGCSANSIIRWENRGILRQPLRTPGMRRIYSSADVEEIRHTVFSRQRGKQ